MSINDNFIRVLPEAIRLTCFPTDPDNPIFQRDFGGESSVVRSFWTTAGIIKKQHWQPFIMNTGSNVKKAISTEVIKNEAEILPPLPTSHLKPYPNPDFNMSRTNFNIQPYVSQPPKINVADMLVSEWIDPSHFLEMAPSTTDPAEIHSGMSSPMCLESGTQSALFNIAVIEEDDRVLRMRHRLKTLQQTIPNVLGTLKLDFINIRVEKEPAQLPSPLKEINISTRDSPQVPMVSLPPIFNHPI